MRIGISRSRRGRREMEQAPGRGGDGAGLGGVALALCVPAQASPQPRERPRPPDGDHNWADAGTATAPGMEKTIAGSRSCTRQSVRRLFIRSRGGRVHNSLGRRPAFERTRAAAPEGDIAGGAGSRWGHPPTMGAGCTIATSWRPQAGAHQPDARLGAGRSLQLWHLASRHLRVLATFQSPSLSSPRDIATPFWG
jgi:hypothetical protein